MSNNIIPDWIHSHSADSGFVAARVSKHLGIPFAHTGHSFGPRIEAEETGLAEAEFITTSTQQEIRTWEVYQNFERGIFHSIAFGIDTGQIPFEIVERSEHGITVDSSVRDEMSSNGNKNVSSMYTGTSHVERYIELVQQNLELSRGFGLKQSNRTAYSKKLRTAKRIIALDIDNTMIAPKIGNPGLDVLREKLLNRPDDLAFAVASGRDLGLVREAIEKFKLPIPDIIISAIGTQIDYRPDVDYSDKSWHKFISYRWNRPRLMQSLSLVDFLELQEPQAQSPIKLSYYCTREKYNLETIRKALGRDFFHVTVLYSHEKFLDILPHRASKSRALRFVAKKLGLSPHKVMTAGDSGNDADMLGSPFLSTVVGNYSPELEILRNRNGVYFAKGFAAQGVWEGVNHFDWQW